MGVPFRVRLAQMLERHGTPLCVGLDPDPERLPDDLRNQAPSEALHPFLEGIVAATASHASAYKMQLASYLAFGPAGIRALADVTRRCSTTHLTILDLKAGDIPHTMGLYRRAAFGSFGFDAMTVNPFLGWEVVEEAARDPARGVFVLLHTSNPGAKDVQEMPVGGRPLWYHLLDGLRVRSREGNVGAVVGATYPEAVAHARRELGDAVPLLIPGVGSQGGDLGAICRAARVNFLVNSSRSILHASSGSDWREAAAREAERLSAQMKEIVGGPGTSPRSGPPRSPSGTSGERSPGPSRP